MRGIRTLMHGVLLQKRKMKKSKLVVVVQMMEPQIIAGCDDTVNMTIAIERRRVVYTSPKQGQV